MHGAPTTPGTPRTTEEKSGWAKTIAIFTTALGLIVLCGWIFNIDALKRLLPGLVSMKANTAAAFVLSGICLYLHTLRQTSTAITLPRKIVAAMILLLGLVTLCEYLFGWNAGIDQLLIKEPAGATLTSHPGRMSNITAANFVLIGGALLLMEARLWMAVQAAVFAVAAATLTTLAGYMIGNLSLLHIGGATSIAAHTAIGFLALATGVLMATQNHGFLLRLRGRSQAIGLAASLLMLIYIFVAAAYNFAQKDKASEWVEHTYEVIVSMESFMDSMHDFLYHNRGFVITGDERQLAERNLRRSAMLDQLARVRQLTSDNPAQQERLAALNKLVEQRIERADLTIQVRREKGLEASVTMMASGKGNILLNEIEAKLNEMEDAEKDMLKERQRVAEAIRSSSLFTLSVLLGASLLLLLWIFRALRREIAERRKTEGALRESEAHLQLERDNLHNIVGSMGDGVYIVNADYDIEYVNPVIEKAFGPIGGRKCYEYFHDRTEVCPWCKNPEVFAGKPVRWEWTTQKTGQTFDLYDAPLRNPDGSVSKIEFFHDITSMKRAEEALRKSEEQFRAVFENAAVGIAKISITGRFLEINECFCRIIGYTRDEVLSQGFTFQQITFPEDLEPDLALVNKLLDGASDDYSMEKRYLRKDASIAWVHLSVHLLRDNERAPLYFISAVQDITERKRAEEGLRISEERLALAVSTGNIGIWDWDVTNNILLWDDSMYRLYGLRRGDFGGAYEAWVSALHPDDRAYTEGEIQAGLRGEREYAPEFRVIWPDGSIHYIKAASHTLFDAKGKPLRMVGINYDLTERKLAEQELRSSEERFRAYFERSMIGMATTSLEKGWINVNDALCETLGYSREELAHMTWAEMTHPEDIAPDEAQFGRVLSGEINSYAMDKRFIHKDGHVVYTRLAVNCVRKKDGSPDYIVALVEDITERILAENEVREKEERLALATLHNGVGVWDWNLVTQEMIWDDSMFSLYHIRREDFIGTEEAWRAALHPDDLHRGDKEVNDAIAGIKPFNTEFRVVWPGGEVRYIKAVAKVFWDEKGTPLRMLGINMDITELRQATTELQEKSSLLRNIINSSKDYIFAKDRELRTILCNEIFAQTAGKHVEDLIGKTDIENGWDPAFVKGDATRGIKGYERDDLDALAGKTVHSVDPLYVDGELHYVDTVKLPLRDDAGNTLGMFGVSRDITENKRRENIQMARIRLTDYAASHTLKELLVATLDEACALTGSSIGFYHFLEADQKTLSLQAWSTRTTKEFCKAAGEGSHYDIEQAGVWVDCVRERRPVIHNDYAALPHKRGMPPGHAHVEREMVVPIFRNELIVAILGVGNKAAPYKDSDLESITQLADLAWDIAVARRATEDVHRLNSELEQRVTERTAQLEAANRDMEGFSYSVSHDLRAPLRAIDGFSRILLEDYAASLDDEGRRLLNIVGDNARKMGELIDDILAFSRTTRNKVLSSEINMDEMVREVMDELKPAIAGSELKLELKALPPAHADRSMMHQVLFNLLGNAVKFTRHQSPALIEVGAYGEDKETVYYVKDNGVGFDMQYVDKLFGVFQRLHGQDEFEGTGIGLAIVKRIIIKHGGRVWAEGKVGGGATIYFALPIEGEKEHA